MLASRWWMVALPLLSLAGCSPEIGPAARATCGDGRVDGDEVCDDGDANGQPGKCLADCSAVSRAVTVSGVAAPFDDAVSGRIEGVIKCRAGVLVNASPPRGMNVL